MIVLDASVILKCFLKEQDSPKALRFLEAHTSGHEQIAVPELLYYEVANALVTKTKLPEEAVTIALQNLLELDLASYSLGVEEYIRAAQLAIRTHITMYDASYPVLAERLGVHFITADRKLADSLKDLKFVKEL
jgi:Predicted nucleic acid-binding protein, contains PIN domain